MMRSILFGLLTMAIVAAVVFWMSMEDVFVDSTRRLNLATTYVDRHHDEYFFRPAVPLRQSAERYAWESMSTSSLPRITKEHFRCRGCELNPPQAIPQANGSIIPCQDCGGAEHHSLPLRDDREMIYPILTDLLNNLQDKTGKHVVITSGHRCPEHNRYVDPAPSNTSSKHMIGAEVDFYVQGLEDKPEDIVALLMNYYVEQEKYGGDKAYTQFSRYDKSTDVSTHPWYNKEVFIKLYRRDEGRNLDNRHPYPYLAVQVRYDFDRKERVEYSWKAAQRYQRW